MAASLQRDMHPASAEEQARMARVNVPRSLSEDKPKIELLQPSKIALPRPAASARGLGEAPVAAKSRRAFDDDDDDEGHVISAVDMATVLHAVRGGPATEEAAYPLELYVVTSQRCDSLPAGCYQYDAGSSSSGADHGCFGPLLKPDLRTHIPEGIHLSHCSGPLLLSSDPHLLAEVAKAAAGGADKGVAGWTLAKSAAILVICGSRNSIEQHGGSYCKAAQEIVTLEAGKATEAARLAAAASGLAACPVAAFESHELRHALGILPFDQAPCMLIALGRPA